MKKVIVFWMIFLLIFFSSGVLSANSNEKIKIISPLSGEIVSGFLTIKANVENRSMSLFVCLIFIDGKSQLKPMFLEANSYYYNLDTKSFPNGNLYLFVVTGIKSKLYEDTQVISIIIDNSESSIVSTVEPNLVRNGTLTKLMLSSSMPLSNVWAILDNGIKFNLTNNPAENQWKKDFFVPLTYNEGSHNIRFEGVDAGGNIVKTSSSFIVCNSEPFFIFPANDSNILRKKVDLKGIYSPGEAVFLYQKFIDRSNIRNVYINSVRSNSKGEWFLPEVSLKSGRNIFSVFSKKLNFPKETFPYQTLAIECFEKGLVVLNYHNITRNGNTFSRTPEQFRKDLEFIKNNGFNPISPTLYLSYLEGKGDLPEKPVLITFDDGLNGIYLNAYPILKEFGYSSIMFIIVSRIGQNLDYLNWKQLSEMQSSRIFSIESHTFNTHFFVDDVRGRHAALISRLVLPDGSIETEEQYISRVTDDLQKSKAIIEENLEKKVLFLSIPFGIGGNPVTKIANTIGYKGTFNSGGGVNQVPFSAWNVKRITIKSTDLLSDFLF